MSVYLKFERSLIKKIISVKFNLYWTYLSCCKMSRMSEMTYIHRGLIIIRIDRLSKDKMICKKLKIVIQNNSITKFLNLNE